MPFSEGNRIKSGFMLSHGEVLMKKVYIWGTGIILERILNHWIALEEIVAFIDNDNTKITFMGKKVIRPEELPLDYDAILVACMYTSDIRKQCIDLKINLERVIFLYNHVHMEDINLNYELLAKVLGDEYKEIVKNRYHLVRTIAKEEVTPKNHLLKKLPMYEEDYIRVKTLELVADEIKERNVPGVIAELGVFRGEFARCINATFPERELYLFDTFDGFSDEEADQEINKGSCTEVFVNAFKNADISSVLQKMDYPDKIIIKKGYFPQTAENLDLQFAFVSLDVDFEESTLNGLEYFYPRLSVGGYLFIHDYNYGYFDCVKKAIKKFEERNQIILCKVPICDSIGTLIVTKH